MANRIRKFLFIFSGIIGVLIVISTALIVDGWRAFGHRAEGSRRARIEKSPEWQGRHFENPQPLVNDMWGALLAAFHRSKFPSPLTNPAMIIDKGRFQSLPSSGLRVTWLGHSTNLVEIDGYRVLGRCRRTNC